MTKIFNCLEHIRQRVGSRFVKFLLLSLSTLWLGLIGFPGVVSAQVVDIPDQNLRAAIARTLNKAPNETITRADMETLVELYAEFRAIADLRGIEFAINLTNLYIGFNPISDISPLSNLTKLIELDLGFSNISDISPLSNLTNLTRLYLSITGISDISPLSNLTKLTRLYIEGNSISDISPLSNLTNLIRLGLRDNSISDISPLSNLTNLTDLDIDGNSISDISPLSNLTKLTDLDIDGNSISDISPLSNLTNLTDLDLRGNRISDISPLSNLTKLTRLYLSDTRISDISPLSNLTNLTWLSLWHNTISNILPLASLTNLTYLNLGDNNISEILPLIALTNLTHLHLHSNNISDIGTLELLMAQGTVVYFSDNPAFETPGPKIEEGWVWLIVPATNVSSGSDAARSGRDFLSEASGGAVTETDVARNGARAGTRVGDSVWTAARLDATDPNNLNVLAEDHNASPVDLGGVPRPSEIPQELGDSVWTADRLDATDPDKRNTLMPDSNLETHIRYPVAYGVVPIQSETHQQTRVYIGGGPLKVWVNGTLVHRDTTNHYVNNYQTAVPVELVPGENLLFVAAYKPNPWASRWGAFFGFQDGTGYTLGPGRLDVNGDGQVNVIDLAMVALVYGTQLPAGADFPADVNDDGIVNILDLTAVAQGIDGIDDDAAENDTNGLSLDDVEAALEAAANLEAVAEAPMLKGHRQVLPKDIAYHNVAKALADARHLGHGVSATLKELLQLLIEMAEMPETTALLPNYPNPFNPETWIPYHLATNAEVMLTIYDTQGVAVRTLTLGHQLAGVYESRARAAYWDGKNALGESVASGVYFYTLTAGEFTATRKLLIVK